MTKKKEEGINPAQKHTVEALEWLDMFGAPVQLNFNGKEEIKTPVGGFVSIFVYCLIFVVVYIKAMDLITGQQSDIITRSRLVPATEQLAFNLNELGFDLYISPFDRSFGEFAVGGDVWILRHMKWVCEPDNNQTNLTCDWEYGDTNITTTWCEDILSDEKWTMLKEYQDQTELRARNRHLCFNTTDLNLTTWTSFDSNSTGFQMIYRNNEELFKYDERYQINYFSYIPNLEEFHEEPLKMQASSMRVTACGPLIAMYTIIKMELNKVEMEDAPVMSFFGEATDQQFVQVGEVDSQFVINSNVLGDNMMERFQNFIFQGSSREVTYKRVAYNLFDFIGDVGGFLDLMLKIGLFMVSFYVDKEKLAILAEKLYFFNESNNAPKGKICPEITESMKDGTRDIVKKDGELDHEVLGELKEYALKRQPGYKFFLKDKILAAFCAKRPEFFEKDLCLRFRKGKPQRYLEAVEKKIGQDLDIVNILPNLHRLASIENCLFDTNQLTLLHAQDNQVIKAEELAHHDCFSKKAEESSEDEQEDPQIAQLNESMGWKRSFNTRFELEDVYNEKKKADLKQVFDELKEHKPISVVNQILLKGICKSQFRKPDKIQVGGKGDFGDRFVEGQLVVCDDELPNKKQELEKSNMPYSSRNKSKKSIKILDGKVAEGETERVADEEMGTLRRLMDELDIHKDMKFSERIEQTPLAQPDTPKGISDESHGKAPKDF